MHSRLAHAQKSGNNLGWDNITGLTILNLTCNSDDFSRLFIVAIIEEMVGCGERSVDFVHKESWLFELTVLPHYQEGGYF